MKPHLQRRVIRLFAVAFSLVLFAGSGLRDARAQASFSTGMEASPLVEPALIGQAALPAAEAQRVEEQLARMLDSDVSAIRMQALQRIIFLAHSQGAAYDFDEAVPKILALYESGHREPYRVMALSALHAIGDEAAMERLRARVAMESSKRVRVLTLVALEDYDGKI